jgi:hypothetical protein
MAKIPERKWMGSQPVHCDVCGGRLGSVFYDVPIAGKWGLACHGCVTFHKPTMGQKYDTKTLVKICNVHDSFRRPK